MLQDTLLEEKTEAPSPPALSCQPALSHTLRAPREIMASCMSLDPSQAKLNLSSFPVSPSSLCLSLFSHSCTLCQASGSLHFWLFKSPIYPGLNSNSCHLGFPRTTPAAQLSSLGPRIDTCFHIILVTQSSFDVVRGWFQDSLHRHVVQSLDV